MGRGGEAWECAPGARTGRAGAWTVLVGLLLQLHAQRVWCSAVPVERVRLHLWACGCMVMLMRFEDPDVMLMYGICVGGPCRRVGEAEGRICHFKVLVVTLNGVTAAQHPDVV